MRLIFWGNGERGVRTLEVLHHSSYTVSLVVTNPGQSPATQLVRDFAKKLGIPVVAWEGANREILVERLRGEDSDLFILAGFSEILDRETLEIPRVMTLNLHAGKLPEIRGSSPMNWALIRGLPSFTLSIIKVDVGVDTGPILRERTFPLDSASAIESLHMIANAEFPRMLLEVLEELEAGRVRFVEQSKHDRGYCPRRFPDDGFILWDMHTAEEIHNRIRAQSHPYSGAFTYYGRSRVILWASELLPFQYFGEPGRIYRVAAEGLYIAASDQCVLVTEAVIAASGQELKQVVKRYETLLTARGWILNQLQGFSDGRVEK